jgi:hypothetical protein
MISKVVNCKSGEKYDVYIGRPSKFSNPFTYKYGTSAPWMVDSREDAIRLYQEWLRAQPELMAIVKQELKGKILGCPGDGCPYLGCHGDILVKISNED